MHWLKASPQQVFEYVGLCVSGMAGTAAAAGDVRVLLIQIVLMLLSLTGNEMGFFSCPPCLTLLLLSKQCIDFLLSLFGQSFLLFSTFSLSGHFHLSLLSHLFIKHLLQN